MPYLVPIALFGWIPLVIALFAMLPPRRAVIAAFIIAWLFLPMAGYAIPGLPDYTKMTATTYGVLLGVAIFDWQRFGAFRPSAIDLPMLIWCICPLLSSMSNDLGWYDGLSGIVSQIIIWGLPYLIGRMYFTDLAAMRELAIGIFIGGLVYVPLCLFEIKMSPQLHNLVYGFHGAGWGQNLRFGGWRPTVFLQHGLMVGMWMAMTALVGAWLWWSGTVRRMWGIPMSVLVAALVITAILCKSLGAIALLGMGLGVLFASTMLRSAVPMIVLMLIAPAWMTFRTTGAWSGDRLREWARSIDEDREGSLASRLTAENLLIAHSVERPVFGWGGWGRNIPQDELEREVVMDAFWMIAFSKYGVVGLASFTLVMLLPTSRLARRYSAGAWRHPLVAPTIALCVLSVIYMLDNLFNAQVQPVMFVVAGALAGAHMGVPAIRRNVRNTWPRRRRHPLFATSAAFNRG